MSDIDSEKTEDDTGISRVLRAAGSRATPSDEMKQAVRAAVHAEWRATVEKRQRSRRQVVWWAAAATVAATAVALWVSRPFLSAEGPIVASVSRTVGEVSSRADERARWQPVPDVAHLHGGESIATGADGRLALQMSDGVSVRLDHDTRVALVDANRINITSGAVYVDAGPTPTHGEHLVIGTPQGLVQHVGTQYEARIVGGATRVSVREGRVDITPAGGKAQIAAIGEQILVKASGAVERSSIAPTSEAWAWASDAAPAFEIDGRSLHDFLAWAGRESGLEIVFASPESAAEAQRAMLSGSVAGMAPDDALDAVLPTTNLRTVRRGGQLVVELDSAARSNQ